MFKINLNDSMLYFGLYVQLRRGSVAGYTTDESWAYGPKESVEAFESITFFIRFIYAINFEHLLKLTQKGHTPKKEVCPFYNILSFFLFLVVREIDNILAVGLHALIVFL